MNVHVSNDQMDARQLYELWFINFTHNYIFHQITYSHNHFQIVNM